MDVLAKLGYDASIGLSHWCIMRIDNFESKIVPEPNSGCWLWTGTISGAMGYGSYSGRPAHRISYELYVGPIGDGMLICHKCDNPLCVNPDHLWQGTHKDNTDDMVRKGRAVFKTSGTFTNGEAHRRARLTTEAVLDIATRRLSSREAAKLYGVNRSLIQDIRSGRTWSHVTGITEPPPVPDMAKRERNAEIVKRRMAGETFRAIGAVYGIDHRNVMRIVRANT